MLQQPSASPLAIALDEYLRSVEAGNFFATWLTTAAVLGGLRSPGLQETAFPGQEQD